MVEPTAEKFDGGVVDTALRREVAILKTYRIPRQQIFKGRTTRAYRVEIITKFK